jgi:hypothetical protein
MITYYFKRIILKTGELITERHMTPDEVTCFEWPAPVVGDIVEVNFRGRTFKARVVWGHWRGRVYEDGTKIPLRVEEISG